jgi:hypothetical protein
LAEACGLTLSCLPYGNYYFSYQSDIDSFQVRYPGCSNLNGDVTIRGEDISNLSGLSSVNSIEGSLIVGMRYGGSDFNPLLLILDGLDSLQIIGEDLWIEGNLALLSLTGLEGLNYLGGNMLIVENPFLSSLSGLDNIDASAITSMDIFFNNLLSDCAVKSICDYLIVYGGPSDIFYNAAGCDSPEEVEAECGVGIAQVGSRQSAVSGYPNPFRERTCIEYEVENETFVRLVIYNQLGQRVAVLVNGRQSAGKHQVTWNAGNLPAGIYLYRLLTADCRLLTSEKLVKW